MLTRSTPNREGGRRILNAPANRQDLLREPFGLLEVSFHQLARGRQRDGQPEIARLSQFLRQLNAGFGLEVRRFDRSQLEQVQESAVMGAQRQLTLIRRFRQAEHLSGCRQPLGHIHCSCHGHMARIERSCEGLRVANPARHLDCFATVSVAQLRLVIESLRKLSKQLGPQSAIAISKSGERVTQYLEHGLIDSPGGTRKVGRETQCCSRKRTLCADFPRQLSGALEGLSRGHEVAGLDLSFTHRERQLDQPLLVSRRELLFSIQGVDRPLIVGGCILVTEKNCGALCGPLRVMNRLADLPRLTFDNRLVKVIGQLGQIGINGFRMRLLESLADVLMKAHSAGRRELVIESLADQRVRKTVLARGSWHFDNHPCRDGFVESLQQPLLSNSAEWSKECKAEVASDHRGQRQQTVTVRRQPIETAANYFAYSARYAEREHAAHVAPAQLPFSYQQSDDLIDEEGIPFGSLVDRRGQPLRRVNAGGQFNELGHLGLR